MNRLLVFLLLAAIPFVDVVLPFPAPTNTPLQPLSLLEIEGKSQGATIPLSTPETARRDTTERSKEASDGVANRDNGSAEIFPDTAIRASNGNGDGMGQKQEVASDGMGESRHGDTGVVVSASDRAGSREGAGLAVRGKVTWYHPDLAGGLMADNQTVYWPTNSGVVAATGYPIGTVLFTCGPSGRCLQLEVRDRGLLTPFTHLDISSYDFLVLSDRELELGVLDVEIRVLEGEGPKP